LAPLIVLLVGFCIASATLRVVRGAGHQGLAGRIAIAVMFVFTGVSHFIYAGLLAEMVPPVFPANLFAAVHEVGMGGHREGTDYLWFRAPLQLLFLAWVVHFGIRRRASPSRTAVRKG